jgi:anti-sigma-K factor RskA
MTDAPLTPREEDDGFAAEYILGVLDAADRARAEDRIKHEPVFAAAVAAWEQRLSGLNDDYAPDRGAAVSGCGQTTTVVVRLACRGRNCRGHRGGSFHAAASPRRRARIQCHPGKRRPALGD